MRADRRRAQTRRAPDLLVDLIRGEIRAAVFDQEEQNIEFGRRGGDGRSLIFHGALVGVHGKGPEGLHRVRFGQEAYGDVRLQEAHGTGLHHIIRRARGEPRENGVLAVERGENNDGRGYLGEPLEELQPHAVFEDEIQNDRVESALFRQNLGGFIHVRRRKNSVFPGEIGDHLPLESLVVLNEQQISCANRVIHIVLPFFPRLFVISAGPYVILL